MSSLCCYATATTPVLFVIFPDEYSSASGDNMLAALCSELEARPVSWELERWINVSEPQRCGEEVEHQHRQYIYIYIYEASREGSRSHVPRYLTTSVHTSTCHAVWCLVACWQQLQDLPLACSRAMTAAASTISVPTPPPPSIPTSTPETTPNSTTVNATTRRPPDFAGSASNTRLTWVALVLILLLALLIFVAILLFCTRSARQQETKQRGDRERPQMCVSCAQSMVCSTCSSCVPYVSCSQTHFLTFLAFATPPFSPPHFAAMQTQEEDTPGYAGRGAGATATHTNQATPAATRTTHGNTLRAQRR